MNWFKKLFAAEPEKPSFAPPLRTLRPTRDLPIVEAKRISTSNVREWCDKLEREGNRTGDRRMIAQAQNIRSRLT